MQGVSKKKVLTELLDLALSTGAADELQDYGRITEGIKAPFFGTPCRQNYNLTSNLGCLEFDGN